MPNRPFDTIDSALQNPEIASAFKKHLATEFSTENIEFHEEMTQFAKDASNPSITDQQLRDKAVKIFDDYVRPDAAKQVNVPAAQVNQIRTALSGLGTAGRGQIAGVLDEAHHEIVKLMSRDSFARFQRTDGFEAAKEQANNNMDAAEKAVEQLQARERQLKLNPSMGDRAKAMVTSGGKVSMIRDLERERESLEKEIEERTQALPIVQKNASKPKVTGPPVTSRKAPLEQESEPRELEEGVVGRGRSNARDDLPKPELHKPSVRESMGDKDASKVGQQKSLGVSDGDAASKASVKDKIKFFEQGGGGPTPPKRGVK